MKSFRPRISAAVLIALATACSYDTTYPTATPPLPATVDVVFCSSAAPKWVAVQDGDGGWTAATPQVGGAITTFHLTLAANRGAIAVARDFASGLTTLAVHYGVPSELAAAGDGTATGCTQSFDRILVGNVAGLDTNEAATISVDSHAFDFVSPLHGTDFRLENVAGGPQDLLAARFTHIDQTTKFTGAILRHGVELTDGGAIPDIDFTSSEAILPVTKLLTLVGANGSASQVYGLRTARGGDRTLSQTSAVGGSEQQLTALPEGALASSDLQFVVASLPPIDGTNIIRAVKTYFRRHVDRSLEFGPVPAAPEVAITATTPALQLSAQFAPQVEYNRAAVISFQQGQSTLVSLAMTDAYARRSGGYRLTLPDFSSIAGFESRWTLDAVRPILWTSSRIGGTLGLGVNAVPRDGTIVRIAADAGNIITP